MAKATARGKAMRNQSPASRAPDYKQILYAPSKHYTLPRLTADEVRRAERQLGIRLPAAYVRLLKYQNGGRLRYGGIFPEQRSPRTHTTRKVYEFESIAGLHSRLERALNAITTVARKEWDLPEGLFPFDGDGHWWLCLDYRKCGPQGEPCITHYDTEYEREARIASSFAVLVSGLIYADPHYQWALDASAVQGDAFDRLLRGLGCRTGRYKHPETWDWPKYRGEIRDEPAYLQVFANTVSKGEQRFLDLPSKHPVLSVDVSPKDQAACIRELAAAFGPDARLIHQPPDRKRVSLDKLPKAVVRRARIPEPPPFYPKEAHDALWDGDVAKVRELLKRGMDPNRRHSADERTPLELAATRGHTAMLKLMLKRAKPPFRGDPLGSAIEGGHVAAAKALLQAGAKARRTHLDGAAMCLQPAAVRLMVGMGLRPRKSMIVAMRQVELLSEDAQVLARMERDRKAVLRILASAM
jgi:hypothetical protein